MSASNPVKLSVQAMKMSSTPRFFRPLSTVAQNLALSFSPTHMLRTSFRPFRWTPMAIYTVFFTIYLHCGHDSGWHPKHNGVDGLQRPLLPLFGNGQLGWSFFALEAQISLPIPGCRYLHIPKLVRRVLRRLSISLLL